MMPSALRPLVVPFASARKGRERPHAHCIERITWKLWGEEAKYCNPWKLWTRQNAGRDPYPWTSSCPCVTFSFFWSCRGTCVSPVSSFFIQWHVLPLGSGSLCGCFVLCFSTWGEGGDGSDLMLSIMEASCPTRRERTLWWELRRGHHRLAFFFDHHAVIYRWGGCYN